MREYFSTHCGFGVLLRKPEYFPCFQIQAGGHSISWDEALTAGCWELYRMGEQISPTDAAIRWLAAGKSVNAEEAP